MAVEQLTSSLLKQMQCYSFARNAIYFSFQFTDILKKYFLKFTEPARSTKVRKCSRTFLEPDG